MSNFDKRVVLLVRCHSHLLPIVLHFHTELLNQRLDEVYIHMFTLLVWKSADGEHSVLYCTCMLDFDPDLLADRKSRYTQQPQLDCSEVTKVSPDVPVGIEESLIIS